MKKFDPIIEEEYENLFAEARASRWAGFHDYAEKLLLKCYKFYKNTRDTKNLIDVLAELVDIYMNSERYTIAISYVHELLDIYNKSNAKKEIIDTLNDLGRIFQNTGKFKEAKIKFKESLNKSKAIKYRRGMSVALTNLASQSALEGNYEAAIKTFLKSDKICEEDGLEDNSVVNLISLASIYLDLGDIEASIKTLDNAEMKLGFIRNPAIVANYYGQTASIYQAVGDAERAINVLQKGLNICQPKGFEITKAQLLLNLGVLKLSQEDFEDIFKIFNEALDIFKKYNNSFGIARTLSSLGYYFFKRNNIVKALKFLNDSQKIAEKINDSVVKIRNYRKLGNIYKEQQNYYESYRNYTQCLINYEQLSKTIHTPALKDSFRKSFADLGEVVHELNLLLESGKISPDVSELIETRNVTIRVCEDSAKIDPNLPKEDLIRELKNYISIVNNLKGPRLESDARILFRREYNFAVDDSGNNYRIGEDDLHLLVKEKCYKDYSNQSIEVDIFGNKRIEDETTYLIGECKYRNKKMTNLEIKCFIIKSKLIAKNLNKNFDESNKGIIKFHLPIISIEGFTDETKANQFLNEYWDVDKIDSLSRRLDLIDKEKFIKLLKKNNLSSKIYEEF